MFEKCLLIYVEGTSSLELKAIIETAIQCGAVDLQTACITEMLMEIIAYARERGDDWMFALHDGLNSLVNFNLHPEVQKWLTRAIITMVDFEMRKKSSHDKLFPGLDRNAFK